MELDIAALVHHGTLMVSSVDFLMRCFAPILANMLGVVGRRLGCRLRHIPGNQYC
jgi:hypothetical protein